MTGTERGPEGMAGLAKGLAIIESFTPAQPQLTVSEAARATGLAPATARRCLLTLTDLGYLYRDGNRFRPTPRMIRLGSAYLEVAALPSLAQPVVTAARDAIGEAVSIAVLDGAEALIVARAEVQRIVNTGVRLGARLPAYASASGRMLLSALPDDEINVRLEKSTLVRTTPRTLVTLEEIRDRIATARAEGVAYTDEELEVGMRSMAVPVVDSAGRIHAAMTTSSFTARASLEDMHGTFLPVLRAQAEALGRTL